ncbi:37S ribosomal protein Rsm22 [Didymella exigua CBS 183.55]|uniref:37S ribosomal protein Rsm22 n=1 Tax=Didymella exigua CBS 183.55 TaxID=1150837 RepID=A0A6A5RZR0_9PLEO|nr:37S ribosomal protein Rsm22 [Didymella exigua CBS 183.55]KAF1933955.1 37S ribosomal protein Rsm22 [Didymella exigua CBS 183.55]
MLKARGLQSACASCRLNLAITKARNARLPQSILALRPAQTNTFTQRRTLITTPLRRQQQAQDQAKSSEEPSLDPTVHKLNIEVNVRKARQQFRDFLPRDHLSAEEFALYERLYGPPIFVDTAEELLATGKQPEEIISEEQPDGSTVLLRRGEDGQLEEIDVYEEEEVDLAEEDEDSMTPEEWEEYREQKAATFHDSVYEQSRTQHEEAEEWEDEDVEEDESFMRAHPMTIAGRFKPSPSTVFLPKETLVDPTAQLLTRANHKHLVESANRIFGGQGLPYSASTSPARLGKEQKPIALDPSQGEMGNIEADAYMAAVQPGTYASVMSALVEVRRRLGTPWIEHMLAKKGGTILDAGSGGVGVLAWQEILKAEWESRQEMSEEDAAEQPTSEEAEDKESTLETVPTGKATVLVSSTTLRHRASRLLENTTFIPRLPEHVTLEDDANTAQPRKVYDVIIAPHTLWPLKQEYLRKDQVSKYWSLLNPKGGVLILIEKGLPRGFEVVAAARAQLLKRHISSPDSTEIETPLENQVSRPEEETRFTNKETGMIIAPCTNHSACPMYQTPGKSPGRKDFCFFTQRYIRPPYLQRILNAKDRNHEDVQFSYLAVQRGRDQRLPTHDLVGRGVQQSKESTDAAFTGHEFFANPEDPAAPELVTPSDVNPLALPRMILPALKRRGHIIIDVCTPAGTLERWTVPRSFSKQAFRDAKKSRWGDLWALGAKTRIPRSVRLGRPNEDFDRKGRKIRQPKKVVIEVGVAEQDGQVVDAGQDRVTTSGKRYGDKDGRYNKDRKIRGSGGRKGRKKNTDLINQ